MAVSNSLDDGVVLMLDALRLTNDEVEYEMRLRNEMSTTVQTNRMLSEAGRLTWYLLKDSETNRDPMSRANELTNEQIVPEIETCEGGLNDITGKVRDYRIAETPDTEAVYTVASRWAHYNYRVARILPGNTDSENVEPAVQERIDRLKESLATNRRLIIRLLKEVPPPEIEAALNRSHGGIHLAQPPGIQRNNQPAGTTEETAPTAPATQQSLQHPPLQQMNSTLRDNEHTPTNLTIDSAELIAENQQTEQRHRECQLNIIHDSLSKLKQIHDLIKREYANEGSNGRADRLPGIRDDLHSEERRLREASAVIPAADYPLRERVSECLTQVNFDSALLLMRMSDIRQQPPVRSDATHSERTRHPTVTLFPHEIDALSMSDQDNRDNTLHQGGQTLANQVPQNTENNNVNMPFTTPRTSRPVPNVPPRIQPNNREQHVRFTDHDEQDDESHGPARQWPGTATSRHTDYYHPATPAHATETALNINRTAPQYDPSTFQSRIDQAKPMNLAQSSQFFSRILGSRKYDGQKVDGNKTISTDEFMGQIRQYQLSTKMTDLEVLDTLSSYVTGAAFTWWNTNRMEIATIDQLEARLKSRFDRMPIDPMSQMMRFCERKQGADEDVCDYIDEMRQLAYQLRPPLEEDRIINKIVDNANDMYRTLLASRSYTSVALLNRHAEYLAQRTKPKKTVQKPVYKQLYRPKQNTKSVYAAEIQPNEEENDIEVNEIAEDIEEELIPTAMVEAVEKIVKAAVAKSLRQNNNNKPSKSAKVMELTTENNTTPSTEVNSIVDATEFACYGCNTPGILKRNCPKCQNKATGVITATEFTCYGCGAPGVMKRNCAKCQAYGTKN